MKLNLAACIYGLVMAAGLTTAGGVAAQGTWNLGSATLCPIVSNSIACTTTSNGPPAGVNATMFAESNTGSGGAFQQANLTQFGINGVGSSNNQETGDTPNGTVPQHAFDNLSAGCGASGTSTGCSGSVELMIINFSQAVNLTKVDFGFVGNDADFSIYRCDTAACAPGGQLGSVATNSNASTSLGAGWTLVGSQDANPSPTGNATVVPNVNNSGVSAWEVSTSQLVTCSNGTTCASATSTNLYSSWWVISTYFGPSSTGVSSGLDAGNDAFKLLAFTANTCSGTLSGGTGSGASAGGQSCSAGGVPEPATLALVSMALVGAGAIHRRRRPVARAWPLPDLGQPCRPQARH